MNSVWVSLVVGVLRWLLTAVSGWLISKGIITEAQSAELVLGIATAIVTLAIALWSKWRSRVLLNTALASPKAMSVDELKAKVSRGDIVAPATVPSGEVPTLKKLEGR